MAKNVLILGAGASKNAGVPLMGEFLEHAIDRHLTFFRDVFTARSSLQAVHSKSQLDLSNLESLFGAFEMARVTGLTLVDGTNPEQLVSSLKRLIARTIEDATEFLVPSSNGELPHLQGYGSLERLCKILRDQKRSLAFITLNYDVVLEYSLLAAGIGYRYCETEEPDAALPLVLKLHGSINWGTCSVCSMPVPLHITRWLQGRRFAYPQPYLLTLATDLERFALKCCEKHINAVPLIVPPTWNKLEYANSIRRVWSSAARELSDAENVFVFGYSLPETDNFFRHLWALGSKGDQILRRFCVFDPDSEAEVRWRRLLGLAATAKFQFFKERYPECLDTVKRMVG